MRTDAWDALPGQSEPTRERVEGGGVVNARPKVRRCDCNGCHVRLRRLWEVRCLCGYCYAFLRHLAALNDAADHARFDCPLNTDAADHARFDCPLNTDEGAATHYVYRDGPYWTIHVPGIDRVTQARTKIERVEP